MPTYFYAAKLTDETNQVSFDRYKIELTREKVIEAVAEIKKESHTPEQITGILSVILANTESLLTAEDKEELFQEITASESIDPFVINITPENFALIYSVIEECIHCDAPDAPAAPEAPDVAEAKITELTEQITVLTEKITELEATLVTKEAEIEELKAKEIAKPVATVEGDVPAPATIDADTEALKQELQDTKTALEASQLSITTLETALADLKGSILAEKVKEAANLAIQSKYPLANEKSLEEVCNIFAERSVEFLDTFIEDTKAIVAIVAPIKETLSSVNVEKVNDVTQKEEAGMPEQPSVLASGDVPSIEAIQDNLKNGITEDDKDAQIYHMFNIDKDALKKKITKLSAKIG